MQDMIRRIVEADNEAKALAEKNLKDAEAQKAKIDDEVAKIHADSLKLAEETIKHNDSAEEAKTEKQWAEISARQNSTLIKLRSDFANNKQRWVDEIVQRVTE